MELLILVISSYMTFVGCSEYITADLNNSNYKDMYVIRAAVYQIGILTNDTKGNDNMTGDQTAVTIYKENGSKIDLKNISQPILTNISGQSIVRLSPALSTNQANQPLVYLNNSLYGQNNKSNNINIDDVIKDLKTNLTPQETIAYVKNTDDINSVKDKNFMNGINVEGFSSENKSFIGSTEYEPSVKVINRSVTIPQEASIKSIDLPSILSFKGNLTAIPVPIPNTSVISYSKIETIIQPKNVEE